MRIRRHANQERMHELCSLAVLGEISPDDDRLLSAHLKVCQECRQLIRELDDIARFDLSAAAAERIEGQPYHDIDRAHEAELLGRVIKRREQKIDRGERSFSPSLTTVPPCPVPFIRRVRIALQHAYPVTGWVTSGALALLVIWVYSRKQAVVPPVHLVTDSNYSLLETEADGWKQRALEAEKKNLAAHQDLKASELENQSSSEALTETSAKYREVLIEKQQLATQLAAQDAKLREQASALNLSQTSLDEERSDAATLRAQLQEVNAHLDQQRNEVARLHEVAATVPTRLPTRVSDESAYDGREIFGARDLHIVDVYDVDHAGNASRTYGRVYYVNQSLLLFYAFDLDHSAKLRKPVAFQAWGFRQPDSKTAESLGLFYLDDAKLDRWTLRVSDPKLLARIDTLFVTVEPPGGSNAPRGRQLLFASLSGPPNHP